ncbi:protein CLAVATA 3 [Alnus glutinosa]|uniref:protein CLAVATA 3 n=1 Tax=Alnus glutinosa TaxID=3517 RepID=UPI002D7769F0|nr:protein CLAVATA 3 [Alnus glutinosa]
MFSKSVFLCVACVVVLCLVFMEEPSDCGAGYGCFYSKAAASLKTENRKLLAGLKEKKEAVKGGQQGSATSRNGRSFVGWELRKVPSGPDPLHHNGGSPKKPRTP